MAVIIKDFNPKLITNFEAERARLISFLGDQYTIEHVGSSAAHIGGKNIIDILIGAKNYAAMRNASKILVKHGYYDGHDNHPDRIFMASSTKETGEGDYHLHICIFGSSTYRDFIILRNYLLDNPAIASAYLSAKQSFATQANYDRKKYKALKSEYVAKLLEAAKRPLAK